MALASIYIPAPNIEEGKRIARFLLEKRYVACVNIVENATSLYHWEGEIKEETEVLLICKTLMRAVRHIIKDIKEIHPYDLPAVTAEPILKVNPEYAAWVEEVIDGGNF